MRLRLKAIPDEIAHARAAIGEFCEQSGIRPDVAENVRLAVSEACTNCVLHAYPGHVGEPTFTLDARLERHALVVVVSDQGSGAQAKPDSPRRERAPLKLGLGLRVIAQAASGVDVSSREGRGTRVAMRFMLDRV